MMKQSQKWEEISLGEICEITTGKYDANHAKTQGRYRFYTCAFEFMRCDTNRFKGECLILPGNGANVGEVFYYNGEFDAYQRTYVLINIKIVPKYLFYHLKFKWKDINSDKQFGSATNYIRMGNFTDYIIPLPPLPEQHRIVAKIEELFSELDKGIETLKTAKQQLKVYRQAVLKYAFEGKLTNPDVQDGELPEGWVSTTFGEIIKISSGDGLPKSKRNDEGEYLVYGGNGISGKHNDYMFTEQKLIIGRVGAHCGNTHITQPNSWVTDNAFVVEFVVEKFDIKFLYYLISNSNFNSLSSSTAQPVISQGKIYPLKTIVPQKINEQIKIIQEIESRLSVCDKIEESIEQGLQQAEALRQSILKKAFEGKLVPQDPNDEPASVLLERIKAERNNAQPEKKTRTKKVKA